MYSFEYENIMIGGNTDRESDLEVYGWDIIGIPNIYCAIDISTLSKGTQLNSKTPYTTWSSGNWSAPCGVYVEY